MKKFKKIIYLLVIVAFVSAACFRVDRNPVEYSSEVKSSLSTSSVQSTLRPITTVNLNNIDYRLSRSSIGKFGGQIVTSTIGEGPKTFNPWVSKDATSSQIGDLLYDSLLSTDPETGEVIPHLAKDIKVSDDSLLSCIYYNSQLRQMVFKKSINLIIHLSFLD